MSQIEQIKTKYSIESQSATTGIIINAWLNAISTIPLLGSIEDIMEQDVEIKQMRLLQLNEPVGHIHSSGFELDINKMKLGEKYIFDYFGSKYMAVKNEDKSVKISEITINE